LLHALCVFLGASIVLVFLVSLVLFATINVWTQQISFGEVALLFICQERSSFHSYQKPSVLLFLLLLLVFVLALICIQTLSYLFIKVYFSLWTMLVFLKKVGLNFFRMVLEKRKKALCKKVVQEGACVECGLGFCISCLMSF
jgi:hypothetical protein